MRENFLRATHLAAARGCAWVAVAMVLLCVSGSAAQQAAGIVSACSGAPADEVRFGLGKVVLAREAPAAQWSFEKAKGQIEGAGDRAWTHAGNLLGTDTGDGLINAVVGVGTFALAPVAAVTGAHDARKTLGPEKLTECEADLAKAMAEMAAPERFRKWLVKAAEEQCRGRLVAAEQKPPLDSNRNPAEAVLEARVEELRLERTGSGDTSYALRIKTRTRLVRAADGTVLYDQPAEYWSGKCLFLDWTLGNSFQRVADTGYEKLAEYIVGQTLATGDSSLLAGAGYKRVPMRKQGAMTRFVRGEAARDGRGTPMIKVSHTVADTGTVEVYSAADVAHVVIQMPMTRDEALSEAVSGVEGDLDGLDNHPNPLVALPAIAAAIPMSLWRQGVAIAGGVSPKKLRAAETTLRDAAFQTRPHERLALQVAQQLAPRTSQFVVLEREPLKPGTSGTATALLRHALFERTAGVPTIRTAGSDDVEPETATLLGIHVQRAALTGTGGANRKPALCVGAEVILVSSRDGRELYSCPVNYRSEGRRFTEWAADDAKLFRSEVDKCSRELGGALVDQLIGRGLVPEAQRPQATFAQR